MVDIAEKLRKMGIGFQEGKGRLSRDHPTLVMIHGAGGQSQIWQNQRRLSNKGIHTLALDMPGHGKTREPAKASIDSYAHWLSEQLHALFDHPVYLMGHSMGGAIVQEVACIHPSPLAGIILVGTGPRLRVSPAFLKGLKDNFEQTVDTLIHFAYTENTDPSIIRAGAELMKAAGGSVVLGGFEACNRFEMGNKLKDIHLPCLIICGEEDKLTPPSLSKTLHDQIEGSDLSIIPGAGHMVMIERPTAFNQCIADFALRPGMAP
ncbi:MAG: alpha/beta hydrolase [Deltaproteobacteria bacterium]|nr:alpha/beta hydrolase [Deltaproteobacteria bacterium]